MLLCASVRDRCLPLLENISIYVSSSYIYIHIIEIKSFYTDRGLLAFRSQNVLFHWQSLKAGSLSDELPSEEAGKGTQGGRGGGGEPCLMNVLQLCPVCLTWWHKQQPIPEILAWINPRVLVEADWTSWTLAVGTVGLGTGNCSNDSALSLAKTARGLILLPSS